MSSRRERQHRTLRTSTRNAILDTALGLFNEEGVAKMSTNRIAAALGISSGNLYYHFNSKEQIAEWLIRRFEDRVGEVAAASESVAALDDMWLALHLTFEAIHAYRFIYRDIDYLIREFPKAGRRVRRLTAASLLTTQQMCRRLADGCVIRASREDVDSLALQIVFTATCWFSFSGLLPDGGSKSQNAGRAAYQVLTLLAPYLEPQARVYLTYLRSKYVKEEGQ
jgi:AcrR family transcriptional regulator